MTRNKKLNLLGPRRSNQNNSLEQPLDRKNMRISGTSVAPPATVTIEVDDDDDVHITSPRSFAQAATSASQRKRLSAERRTSRAENRTATEDPLELRLGLTSVTIPAPSSTAALVGQRMRSRPVDADTSRAGNGSLTIDLTRPSPAFDNDCILVNEFVQKKRKPVQPTEQAKEVAKELKLTCAICIDTMKEETSTICGHIFCKKCLMNALSTAKKCPTCRQNLKINQVHRIYISNSLRNP